MVPIYETDLTSGSDPSPSDWRNYELWEKIELRRKRARRLWILGTLSVSLGLLSIPTVVGSRGKWTSEVLARELAQELVSIKKDAAVRRMPRLITFAADGSLRYRVETVARCPDSSVPLDRVSSPASSTGGMVLRSSNGDFRILGPAEGQAIGIPGLITSFCYNPVVGSPQLQTPDAAVGFGIIAVKDLAEGRADRIAIVLLKGESAEISFN